MRPGIGGRTPEGDTRKVELIVNGKAVASKDVPADNQPHDLTFSVPIEAAALKLTFEPARTFAARAADWLRANQPGAA